MMAMLVGLINKIVESSKFGGRICLKWPCRRLQHREVKHHLSDRRTRAVAAPGLTHASTTLSWPLATAVTYSPPNSNSE